MPLEGASAIGPRYRLTTLPVRSHDVTIETARWADIDPTVAYQIMRLRVDVFVVEQACVYPELDGRDLDADTTHLWVAGPGDDGGTPIAAYLRVLDRDQKISRIGRVVTHPAHRGQGLAEQLMHRALGLIDGPSALDAQTYLTEWYERFGFVASGPEFIEDGIPHTPMTRA